jgi:hypothetical protein
MVLMAPSPRTAKLLVVAGVLSFIIITLHLVDGFSSISWSWKAPNAVENAADQNPPNEEPQGPPCASIPGADDVLVVMRTGATEIKDKLTVHLDTTFKCYKHLVIFSDFEETFEGHQVHDVLRSLDPEIKQTNKDFKLYQHIQEVGREGLDESELSGTISYESGSVGKTDNAGWRLDKWKFLPMANETLHMHPDFKWYVFIEPDTYLVWSTLLQWLPKLDPTKASYYGSEVMIGGDIFAHGGSSFVLSKPALEKAAELYNKDTSEWDDFVAGHWAGDCVLGKALSDVGVPVSRAFPMIQGGNFHDQMNWDDGNPTAGQLWCRPAISYHHFTPNEVRDFWNFEQSFIKLALMKASEKISPLAFWKNSDMPILHHRDVFKLYVQPTLNEPRTDWNNTPEHVVPLTEDLPIEGCRAVCQSMKDCKQYALGNQGCHTGDKIRIGSSDSGVQSGWLEERIQEWTSEKDRSCKGQEGWSIT